jgi:cytochrome c oxidase subunit 3
MSVKTEERSPSHDPHEVELRYPVAHHFDDAEQQHEASILGMWSFLATEVLFFGGLFTAYVVYRTTSPIQVTLASHHLSVRLGGINTAVLLVSSLLVALAVREAQLRRHKNIIYLLLGTIALGLVFLGIKGYEWWVDYEERLMPFILSGPKAFEIPSGDLRRMLYDFNLTIQQTERFGMFFVLYFFMTGLHAIHMIVGVGIMGTVCYKVHKKQRTGGYINMVEVAGLYWHFVDIVWVFLYPLLYLIDPHLKSH